MDGKQRGADPHGPGVGNEAAVLASVGHFLPEAAGSFFYRPTKLLLLLLLDLDQAVGLCLQHVFMRRHGGSVCAGLACMSLQTSCMGLPGCCASQRAPVPASRAALPIGAA